jgi:predicted small secreted protein
VTADSTHSSRSGAAAVIVALTAALACALSACNTTEGVGKDIKAAGSGIEKAASDAK